MDTCGFLYFLYIFQYKFLHSKTLNWPIIFWGPFAFCIYFFVICDLNYWSLWLHAAPARLPSFHTCVGANEERLTPKWYKEHGNGFSYYGPLTTSVNENHKRHKSVRHFWNIFWMCLMERHLVMSAKFQICYLTFQHIRPMCIKMLIYGQVC